MRPPLDFFMTKSDYIILYLKFRIRESRPHFSVHIAYYHSNSNPQNTYVVEKFGINYIEVIIVEKIQLFYCYVF